MRWKIVEDIDNWDGSPEVNVFRRKWVWWTFCASFDTKDEAEAYVRGQSQPSYYDDNGAPLPQAHEERQ